MNKQRRIHREVVVRERMYKASRLIADKEFGYKHLPRWRAPTKAQSFSIFGSTRTNIQMNYGVFGPSIFGAYRDQKIDFKFVKGADVYAFEPLFKS